MEDTIMTLVKWYNRPAFEDMFDNLFEREFNPMYRRNCGVAPATNILERNEDFVIHVAAPGYTKEDFNIKLEQNILTISSEKEESNDEQAKFTRKEFGTGAFKRTFTLPRTIDTDRIDATYEQGILKVTLPKKEEAKVTLNKMISVN